MHVKGDAHLFVIRFFHEFVRMKCDIWRLHYDFHVFRNHFGVQAESGDSTRGVRRRHTRRAGAPRAEQRRHVRRAEVPHAERGDCDCLAIVGAL